MIYRYDKEKLEYIPAKNFIYYFTVTLLIAITSFILLIVETTEDEDQVIKEQSNQIQNLEQELIILKSEDGTFSEEDMVQMLLDMNVKFPDIVLAQARYESGHFTSNIWLENNNPFGMKVAVVRPSSNKGAQFNHALYDSWKDATLDYALWQAAYGRKLKTRDEYFTYLKSVYAEGAYSSIHSITKDVQEEYPELYVEDWPFSER